MAKKWSEVEQSQDYINLPPQEQRQAKREYWDAIVSQKPEFQKLSDNQINALLALYLNSSRVNTSLLGVKNKPRPNQFITRTILV